MFLNISPYVDVFRHNYFYLNFYNYSIFVDFIVLWRCLFYFGETLANGSYGNTKERGEKQTTPVGRFPPNNFELYDLHGNLWEWCADDWHDNYQDKPQELKDNGGIPWLSRNQSRRVLRGGSWMYEEWNSRSAYRVYDFPDVHYDDNGFRLALSIS
jgi:formylglycine-generating enzyme required for sulfatase activity